MADLNIGVGTRPTELDLNLDVGTVMGVYTAGEGIWIEDRVINADVTQEEVDSKAAVGHKHVIADVDGLQAALDGKANIADGSVTTEMLANGAVTSGKIAKGAVGNYQLADDAVLTGNIMDGSVSSSKINASAKQELVLGILYATDATTAQTLTALGFTATVLTPKNARSTTDAYGTSIQMSTRSMLCWIDTASGYLEKAPLGFSGNLQSQTITLWAKGLHSMATGTLGVDTSWTITALPTDADGVSY